VFVAVRDVEKTKVLLDEINAAFPNNGGLEIVKVELDSLASVNAAADDFLKRSSELNVLVNNAGVSFSLVFYFSLSHSLLPLFLSFSFSFSLFSHSLFLILLISFVVRKLIEDFIGDEHSLLAD
jgi:NAD(P)-dependent dehydrogenase (short-subunit alcohol dehydrogenase family)